MEGELEWEYQKRNARNAIQNLTGVRSVANLITIKPKLQPFELEQKIASAFKRNAVIDAGKVNVGKIGNKVIQTGKVRSMAESEDA